MKRKMSAGQTSASLPIFIQDTSSTTGGGLSGVTHSSSGLVLEYRRRGQSAWTSVTPVTKTLGTFVSGGIVADGALAGAYELDMPDAAFASGARWVAIRVRGVTNMLPVLIEIELDAVDYQDNVRFGLTAMPNVASGSAGAILTSGTGTAQLSTSSGLVTLAGVTHTGAVIPTVSDVTTKTGYSLLATTGLGNQTANITGNLSGSVGSVTGAVGSVTGNVGGNVVGSVASVTNAIVLPNIPTNWITAAGIASAAFNGKGDWNIGKTGFSLLATTGLGNQTANITGNLSGSVGSVTGAVGSVTGSVGSVASGIPTAAAIAAQVWSETIPGSYTSGQAGGKLNSAGAAGDPWNTALPGSYAAGTAGYIVGVSLPRYGDTQRWTSPTNTLDVTISKV